MRTIDLRSPQDADPVITLTRDDVDLRHDGPSPALVTRVADMVMRRQRLTSPGFVIIRNPKEFFGTTKRVRRFQRQLMRALLQHAQRKTPDVLRRTDFLSRPRAEATKVYARAKLRFVGDYMDGRNSSQGFHFDYLHQLFVSLSYGRRANIWGGWPLFADTLRMASRLGKRRSRSVLKVFPGDGRAAGYDDARYALEQPRYTRSLDRHTVRIVGLDCGRMMPISIFSNRIEDGILHGRTPIRRNGKPSSRAVYYYAISY